MQQKQINQEKLDQVLRSGSRPERDNSKYPALKRLGAIALVAVGIAGTIYAANEFHEMAQGPEFSQETTEYKVQPGDGIWDASRQIENVETISKNDAVDYIQDMPENAEALSDGLQPNETIVVPKSVNNP